MTTVYLQRLDQFLQRVPKKSPVRVIDSITTAFQIVENAREKFAAIRADTKLSREGQNAAIAAAMSKGLAEHMRQLRAATDRDLESVKAEREGMRRRVTNPEAPSKFSDAMKSEVRQWMRGLSEKERLALAHTTKDPLITEAITTAPHYLSGVQQDHWQGLIDRTIEQQNGARLHALATEEAAFLEADAAIKVATADLRRESGLGEIEFAAVAA